MSPTEAAAMAEHMSYWTDRLGEGGVYVYGPAADPSGLYGLAVVEADDAAAVRAMTDGDPAVCAGLGLRYETSPMLQAALHPRLGPTRTNAS